MGFGGRPTKAILGPAEQEEARGLKAHGRLHSSSSCAASFVYVWMCLYYTMTSSSAMQIISVPLIPKKNQKETSLATITKSDLTLSVTHTCSRGGTFRPSCLGSG
ncbi:hypothetical protein SeMB42_g06745 [Synchytrium endobioticum]|uniref:Uncharacterized protein n=1 Tax=Synchytrium endobioticum TaxID=286115 RepID=A0A507CKI0_9FUNG|nr:hypothetical protein SeMB42_g06745 [Synchytrium endobioticum]